MTGVILFFCFVVTAAELFEDKDVHVPLTGVLSSYTNSKKVQEVTLRILPKCSIFSFHSDASFCGKATEMCPIWMKLHTGGLGPVGTPPPKKKIIICKRFFFI